MGLKAKVVGATAAYSPTKAHPRALGSEEDVCGGGADSLIRRELKTCLKTLAAVTQVNCILRAMVKAVRSDVG